MYKTHDDARLQLLHCRLPSVEEATPSNVFIMVFTALSILLSLMPLASAQNATTDFSRFFNITTFPNQQWSNASSIIDQAREIAGQDTQVWPHFLHRCIRQQAYPELGNAAQLDGFIESFSPFKNVFFVGQSHWSSWAIDTGNREILLIDTLGTPDEAERIIVPGLKAHGYSGSDVKYILITHEHFDHYGGAAYFQKRWSPYVYASEAAWKTMANESINPPLYYNYSNARAVADGETLTFNDFSVNVHHTPGHTPGTISFLFPVQDTDAAGTRHTAGLFGGGGIPSAASAKVNQANSFRRFSEIAKEAGADVLMSNHQTQDGALWNFDLLRYRECGTEGCNMPNPFVVGTDTYVRYLTVMGLCARLQAARDGQNLPSSAGGSARRSLLSHECEG